MCGIIGYIGKEFIPDEKVGQLEKIQIHRGPDG
jgi:asparagine synthetase B (glutamine-hydrolysing)